MQLSEKQSLIHPNLPPKKRTFIANLNKEAEKSDTDDNEVIQPAKRNRKSNNNSKATRTKRVKRNDDIYLNDIKAIKFDKTKDKTYVTLQLDKLYKIGMTGEICGVKTYDTGRTWNLTLDKTIINSLTYKEGKGRAKKLAIKDRSDGSGITKWKKMIIESVESFINKKFIMDKESRDNNTNKVIIKVFPYKENGKVCLRYRCEDKRPIIMLSNGDSSKIKTVILDKDVNYAILGEKVKVTVIPDNICLIPNKPGCGYDENIINVSVNMKIV